MEHFYAQRGEDRMLLNFLGLWPSAKNRTGFYVDIGAWEPSLDSVTKHFYDHGWNGINVEPSPFYYPKLVEERPRDINLMFAISDEPGWGPMTFFEGSGLSTLNEEFAAEGAKQFESIRLNTRAVRLDAMLDEYLPVDQSIDFLKIDVEGWEKYVIQSNDWEKYRPRILVIESTLPNSPIQNHHKWEPIVLAARYEYLDFDGLNRYYCRQGV